jgi:hypothetical protein
MLQILHSESWNGILKQLKAALMRTCYQVLKNNHPPKMSDFMSWQAEIHSDHFALYTAF